MVNEDIQVFYELTSCRLVLDENNNITPEYVEWLENILLEIDLFKTMIYKVL